MIYYLLIALQLYCAYHVYSTKNNAYWYLAIILAPGIGSAIYLVTQVFTKRDVDKVQQEVTAAINPTKKVQNLEKKVAFSDTFQNRLDLADAYMELNDFANAVSHYETALSGSHRDDFYGNAQLMQALFSSEKYAETVAVAKKIEAHKEFEKSRGNFLYGQALFKLGETDKAEEILRKIDRRYSNYEERLVLVKFLEDHGKRADAVELLDNLVEEGNNLTKPNQKRFGKTFLEIRRLHKELQS